MRQFESKHARLTALPFGMKVLMSVFIFLSLAGFVIGYVMGVLKSGWLPTDVATYYRGDSFGFVYPKSFLELLETAHFHLMSIPVIFLVICHLYLMASLTEKQKYVWITVGTISIVGHILGPFLIRYVSAFFVYIKCLATLTLGVALFKMSLKTVCDLFAHKKEDIL